MHQARQRHDAVHRRPRAASGDPVQDLNYDRAHNPRRPLASGAVAVRDVGVLMWALGGTAMFALGQRGLRGASGWRPGWATFEASLRIHNDNELVLDHQAGAHLPGMVLTEAARQMFLAMCEFEYLRPWPDRKFAFLLMRLDTRFDRPVFPIPVRMRLTAHRAEVEDVNRMRFDTETRFVQCGQETATATMAVSVRPLDRARPVELRHAETAVAALEKARPPAGR